MENALSVLTRVIEGLILENKAGQAIDEMLKFDVKAQINLRSDLILMKAQFNQLQDNVVRGFYDPTDKEYVRSMNLLKYNITQVLH
ncbi:MAG: hypothetical protein JNJ57_08055, partial [Saprospiraceae bacterium]|nr:hypothetical protein [Saprospiraceae bacterium]